MKYSSMGEFYYRYNLLKVRMDLAKEDLLTDKEGVVNIENFDKSAHNKTVIVPRHYSDCKMYGNLLVEFLQSFNLGDADTNAFINGILSERLRFLINVAEFLFFYDNPYAKAFIYELKPLYNKCKETYEEDFKSCKDS